MQIFGTRNVFYVVEHERDEEELKPEEAGVERPECKLCAQNVFYDVEHLGSLDHNYIISQE